MMEDIPNDHTLILISKNTNLFAIIRNQTYIKFHNIQKCQNIILESRKIKIMQAKMILEKRKSILCIGNSCQGR